MSKEANYFEILPWDYIVSEIHTRKLGKIAAINVFGPCFPESLPKSGEEWKEKIVRELGEPKSWDVLLNGKALTAIGKFAKDEIVRLFFYEADGDAIVSFEIVTTNSLIVWRPDMHAFSVVDTPMGSYSDHTHPLPVEL